MGDDGVWGWHAVVVLFDGGGICPLGGREPDRPLGSQILDLRLTSSPPMS